MCTLQFALPLLCILAYAGVANAADVAVCGSSEGHAYYPSAGLSVDRPATWTDDPISSGRITLSLSPSGHFDLLFSDATGAVVSATQDGADVIRVGQNDIAISVLVVYPMLIETYTFLLSKGGPEVMWTTNKHSAPIPKAGVYRAGCTFINLPST